MEDQLISLAASKGSEAEQPSRASAEDDQPDGGIWGGGPSISSVHYSRGRQWGGRVGQAAAVQSTLVGHQDASWRGHSKQLYHLYPSGRVAGRTQCPTDRDQKEPGG